VANEAQLPELPGHVARGLARHLEALHQRLATGERRVGWKVAFNAPQVQRRLSLPYFVAAGLTSRSALAAGSSHALGGAAGVALEGEVAVRLGADVAAGASLAETAGCVSGWAPAIEVVQLDRSLDELEEVLAHGVFHRGLVLGPFGTPAAGADLTGIRARVRAAGTTLCDVDARAATGHVPALLQHIATLLARFGERLAAGDVLILGCMNPPCPAVAGSRFEVSLDGLGEVSLDLVD
jgi:2-keto-4-pentenoate hydratase